MQVPVLQLFCGSLSPKPWHNGVIGVCWFEIYFFIPIIILCTLFSLVYCACIWKYLAFDSLYCSILYFRVAVDVAIITNSCVTVVLSFLLPYFEEGFSINSRFIVIHNLLTAILWIAILVFDFLHGKATKYSSRGPLLFLVFSFAYLLCCVINCWSFRTEVDEFWRPFIVANCYIHLFLLCLHLFSKVPVLYPSEEPRRRRARILRGSRGADQLPQYNEPGDISQGYISQSDVKCEDLAPYISRVFFCWVSGLIRSGYYGELYSLRNLPILPKRLNTYILESKLPDLNSKLSSKSTTFPQLFERLDHRYSLKASTPFLKAFFKPFGREFIFLGILKLLLSCFSLCSPVILNHFILSITSSQTPTWSCILTGLGLVLLSFKIALLSTSYNYRMASFSFKVRVSVSGMVYRTILSLKTSSLSAIGTGSLVNYLTCDADRIVNLATSVHEIWAMPLQLLVAVSLLYRQLGLACLVGVGFLAVLLPLNRILATQIGKFSRRLMLFKDARIKLMSEMLSNMLSVKLACWENLMKSLVMHSRVQELKALRGQKLLDACCVFFWAVCPALLASSTFATYVAMGNELKASVVFPSLALFSMLIGPMNAFPWVINGVMEATISMQRVSKLFHLPRGPFSSELTNTPLSDNGTPTDVPIVCSFAEKSTISMPVNILNESFFYTNPDNLVLKNISLQVQWGELIGVVGPVGSGKSSLLLSILGELQSVLPENETIKENLRITSRLRYAYTGSKDVAVDFIVELKDGTIKRKFSGSLNSLNDRHLIHESICHKKDISVDNNRELSNHNVGCSDIDNTNLSSSLENDDDDTPLIDTQNNTTTNIYQSNSSNLNGADTDDVTTEHMAIGSITPHVYKSYIRAVGYLLTFFILLSLVLMQGTRNASDWWLSYWIQDRNLSSSLSYKSVSDQGDLFPVHSINYKAFFSDSKHDASLISCNPSITDMQTAGSVHNSTSAYHLQVYAFIVTSNIIATVFRAVVFAFGGLIAAAVVHESALDTILEGRLNYFDTTPQGRILNRFSSDVGTVDDALPFQLNILLASLAGLLGALCIVCISLPTLIFFLLPLVFIFWSIQRQYRGAARDLKRISSIVRSPVYAHYTDSLSGLAVIRGLGQEIRFRQMTASKLNDQIRAELASLAAGSWLSVRLQLIGTGVIASVVGVSLVGRLFNWTQVAAIGLSTTYALNIAGLMTSTVYDMTETEKNLVAVERCQELTDDTPIEYDTISVKPTAPQPRSSSHNHLRLPKQRKSGITYPIGLPLNWPASGSVYFSNVSLTYRRNYQSAIKQSFKALEDINFTIKAGEFVGIVGRTGSGKSSLIKVLMRLVDHLPGPHTNQYIANQIGFVGATGQVFVDGVDIRTIPLGLLRSQILTICQEPFLFSGCLRDNLDPENHLDDSILEEVLLKCQLAENRLQASEWLTRNVGESGRHVSVGQRQLICLARALLRQPRPKIICLDEATASVDNKCEEIIHQILEQEFQGATVLLIAHRLSSVRRLCSRVIVMQSGRIIADGPPEETLSSVFKHTKTVDLIKL
ncbi:unnamed protein product [Heterobilharzia americana]|nr:unnamed protein product [Heterobilharzia americana]